MTRGFTPIPSPPFSGGPSHTNRAVLGTARVGRAAMAAWNASGRRTCRQLRRQKAVRLSVLLCSLTLVSWLSSATAETQPDEDEDRLIGLHLAFPSIPSRVPRNVHIVRHCSKLLLGVQRWVSVQLCGTPPDYVIRVHSYCLVVGWKGETHVSPHVGPKFTVLSWEPRIFHAKGLLTPGTP